MHSLTDLPVAFHTPNLVSIKCFNWKLGYKDSLFPIMKPFPKIFCTPCNCQSSTNMDFVHNLELICYPEVICTIWARHFLYFSCQEAGKHITMRNCCWYGWLCQLNCGKRGYEKNSYSAKCLVNFYKHLTSVCFRNEMLSKANRANVARREPGKYHKDSSQKKREREKERTKETFWKW